MELYLVLIGLACLAGFLYMGRGYWAWVTCLACLMAIGHAGMVTGEAPAGDGPVWLYHGAAGIAAAFALMMGFRPLRRAVVSGPLMRWVGSILPRMGDTERTALEAGSVWWDGDLFSGKPDWKKLIAFASRFAGSIEHMRPHRRFGNRVLTGVLRVVARSPISDGQSGYRALSQAAAAAEAPAHRTKPREAWEDDARRSAADAE